MLQLGTLQADISADTSGLLAAENQVATSTKKINTQLSLTEKAAGNTGNSFKLVGRNAGQAGIQIQQFVGQIQGGQNAFVALSQQAADLGFVLGAPLVGVVVSLAAVVGGVLWDAFNGSAEAAERAATSASDLQKEYLKLTEQTQALEAKSLQDAMIKDAKAIESVSKELRDLKDLKEYLINSQKEGMVIDPTTLRDTDRAIADTDNKLQNFINMNEVRAKKLSDVFKGIMNPEDEGGTNSGDPFGSMLSEAQAAAQKEIATLELRAKLFGDSNAKIEAEIMRYQLASAMLFEAGSEDAINAEQALADKRIELHKNADDKIKANEDRNEKLRQSTRATALNGLVQLGDQMNQALENSGREGTAIAKAIFLAQKAIQVVSILAATEVAAANAAAVSALGGPVPFFATQGAIRATGYASAGLVGAMAVGEAFENGGIVGGSSFSGDKIPARVNSGEMILNKGQQSKLFNMANGGGQGSKQANVTIISNGTPQTVTSTQIGRDEIAIMINDAAINTEKRINGSLATGRGASAQSLNRGFKVERNLR